MHTHTHKHTDTQLCKDPYMLCIHAYICIHIQQKHKYTYSCIEHRSYTHILLHVHKVTREHLSTHAHMVCIQVEFIFICGGRSRLRCFCVFCFCVWLSVGSCRIVVWSLSFSHQLPGTFAKISAVCFLFHWSVYLSSPQIPHCLAHSRFIMHFKQHESSKFFLFSKLFQKNLSLHLSV